MSTNGTSEPESTEEQDTSRAMDAELKTMGRINRLMQDLDADARRRVANWIFDRWEISPADKLFDGRKRSLVEELKRRETR